MEDFMEVNRYPANLWRLRSGNLLYVDFFEVEDVPKEGIATFYMCLKIPIMNFGMQTWTILSNQQKVQGQGGIDLIGQGLPHDHIGQVQEGLGGHDHDHLKAKDTIHMNTISLDIPGLEAGPGKDLV